MDQQLGSLRSDTEASFWQGVGISRALHAQHPVHGSLGVQQMPILLSGKYHHRHSRCRSFHLPTSAMLLKSVSVEYNTVMVEFW